MINACIDCGVKISKFAKRCRSCAVKGNKHPRWKDGRTSNVHKCLDCSTMVNVKSTRCRKCANKHNGLLKVNRHLYQSDCQCCSCKAIRGEYTGNKNPMYGVRRFGKLNPCFRGWKTKLHQLIRGISEYKQWRTQVYERDNYTCQECNYDSGHILEAHHITPFSVLLGEFLKEYSYLSPLEDKEELMRRAIGFKDFWDISNGITLCQNCHNKIKVSTLEEINVYQQKQTD